MNTLTVTNNGSQLTLSQLDEDLELEFKLTDKYGSTSSQWIDSYDAREIIKHLREQFEL